MSGAKHITIRALAIKANKNPGSLSRVARRLKITKSGRDYLLTAAQAEKVLDSLGQNPGPRKKSQKSGCRKSRRIL